MVAVLDTGELQMKRECSICKEQFDDKDSEWPARRDRHVEKHQRQNANNSLGQVTWITVWD